MRPDPRSYAKFVAPYVVAVLTIVIMLYTVSLIKPPISTIASRVPPSSGLGGHAETYYIDYNSGSDSNNGLTPATAWKDAPGMAQFSASYTHVAGDRFIFKGDETWPAAEFPWVISNGGSASAYDYYGVNKTYYVGSSWNQPIFNVQSERSLVIYVAGASNVTLDNFNIEGEWWSGTPTFGTSAAFNIGTSTNVIIDHMYAHGWTHAPADVNDTTDAFFVVVGNPNPPQNVGSQFINSVVNGSSSGPSGYSGYAVYNLQTIANVTCFDIPNCFVTADVNEWIHNNNIFGIKYSFSGVHENSIEVWGGNEYIYDNIIHDTINEVINVEFDTVAEIYNNVIWNTSGYQDISIDEIFTSDAEAGVVNITDNILGGPLYIRAINRTGSAYCSSECEGGYLNIQDNLFLDSPNATSGFCWDLSPNCQYISNIIKQNNVYLTAANTLLDGYTPLDFYRTTSSGAPTVNAGAVLACSICFNFGYDILEVERPTSGSWDVGAYQYSVDLPFVSISHPSNVVVDVGQYETFNAGIVDDLANPYTYYFYSTNSITPSIIVHQQSASTSSTSDTFTFQMTANDQSNSLILTNAIVKDADSDIITSMFSPTPSEFNDTYLVNPKLVSAMLTPSPALPGTLKVGQKITFTSSWSGGTAPYTVNYIISNSVTKAVITYFVNSNINSTTNSLVWKIPISMLGNTIEVNAIVTDNASTPATINSIYAKTLTINPPPYIQINLTSGSTWTVPSNWNDQNNTVEVIGGGAGGSNGQGGGGGGYAKAYNITLTSGSTVDISVGSGGAGGVDAAGSNGGNSYVCNAISNCASISGKSVIAGANGGAASGAGGSGMVGGVLYSGGVGAAANIGAGGGGGAAGPYGAGGAGGNVNGQYGSSGGGGGGSAGGIVSASNDGLNGSDGGTNYFGAGAGIAGIYSGSNYGSAGAAGGGGGGSAYEANYGSAGAGGAGTEWGISYGAGGGGGGGGQYEGNGGNGGLYGGGGGGGSDNGNGGNGAQGLIVITYTPPTPIYKTYYISYTGGSDSNNGLTPATAWKDAPGMQGFTASYTHHAGDQFIFEGGVTWPASEFPWNVTNSGSPSQKDYYGVNKTWYAGGSWRQPIFNLQSEKLLVLSTWNGGFGISNVTFDNFNITGQYWSGTPSYPWSFAIGLQGSNITVEHMYIHGWTHAPYDGGATTDVYFAVLNLGCNPSCTFINSIVNGSASTVTGNSTLVSSGYGTDGMETVENDTFSDIVTAINSGSGGTFKNNTIHNITTGLPGVHNNAIQVWSGTNVIYPTIIADNKIYDTVYGVQNINTEPSNGLVWIYDNIIWNTDNYADINIDDSFANTVIVNNGGVNISDNILIGPNFIRAVNRSSTNHFAFLNIRDNLFIGAAARNSTNICYDELPECQTVDAVNLSNNLFLTSSQAAADGYLPQSYYETPNANSPTVNAGVVLRCLDVQRLAYEGVYVPQCPSFTQDILGVDRPTTGNWDIGALQYTGGTTSTSTSTTSTSTLTTTSTTTSTTSTTSTSTLTTTSTTTSTTSTTSTSTLTTTSTTTTPSGGGGSSGGGGGGGGGGGSHKPVVSLAPNGYTISAIAQKDTFNVTIQGFQINVTENYIGPSSAGITINDQAYSLVIGSLQKIPSNNLNYNYSIELSNVSYIPILHTITLYINATQTSIFKNSTITTTIPTTVTISHTTSSSTTSIKSTAVVPLIHQSPNNNDNYEATAAIAASALIVSGGAIYLRVRRLIRERPQRHVPTPTPEIRFPSPESFRAMSVISLIAILGALTILIFSSSRASGYVIPPSSAFVPTSVYYGFAAIGIILTLSLIFILQRHRRQDRQSG